MTNPPNTPSVAPSFLSDCGVAFEGQPRYSPDARPVLERLLCAMSHSVIREQHASTDSHLNPNADRDANRSADSRSHG